jgi:hypothetical protein
VAKGQSDKALAAAEEFERRNETGCDTEERKKISRMKSEHEMI